MDKNQLEKRVAEDLIEWGAKSPFVYELDSDGVYAVTFTPDGEPIDRYRVTVTLTKD